MTNDKLVVISNNVLENRETGKQTVTTVYHSLENSCKNAPKRDHGHRMEIKESIALAFGRRFCALCLALEQRTKLRQELDNLAEEILGSGLQDFVDQLPTNFEFRILCKVPNKKTPVLVWTNKDLPPRKID